MGLLPGKATRRPGPRARSRAATAATGAASGEPRVWIDGLGGERANGAARCAGEWGWFFRIRTTSSSATRCSTTWRSGRSTRARAPAEARAIALDCLGRVELTALADRPPHHLSFGERKRACLAGVLACEPSVLVLDEPSANLDPRARRRFIQILRGLSCTKLIATHDLELVLEVCPRTVVLDQGRVAAEGESRAILGDAALMEAHGLEQPLSLRRGEDSPSAERLTCLQNVGRA